jgi:hypothetical protein
VPRQGRLVLYVPKVNYWMYIHRYYEWFYTNLLIWM